MAVLGPSKTDLGGDVFTRRRPGEVGLTFKRHIRTSCRIKDDTVNKCKDAADTLGFSFYKVFNHEGYPAGCYYVYRIHVGFNQITDPSLTKPKTFGHGAGLCERP